MSQGCIRLEYVYYLNAFTATIHLISGSSISYLASKLDPVAPSLSSMNATGPYLPAVCFDPSTGGRPRPYVEPEPVAEYRDYITTLVVMFFFLSAGFQYAQCIFKETYKMRLQTNGVNELRYVEYCLSASVMMILIACAVGVLDVFTHILIFTCTFLCMLQGLAADFIRVLTASIEEINETQMRQIQHTESFSIRDQDETHNNNDDQYENNNNPLLEPLSPTPSSTLTLCVTHGKHLMWSLHFLGWVAILVPYVGVFMVAYFTTVNKNWKCLDKESDDLPDVPPEVTGIIISQFILFIWFGIVQLVQFSFSRRPGYDKESIGVNTEIAFVILSLGAKSILGWLAAAYIIFV